MVKISSGFTGDATLNDGKYRLTRIETIAQGVVNENRIGYSNEMPKDQFKLQKGDILFSNINSLAHIGKVALFRADIDLYHGINLLRLHPNKDIIPYFLYQSFNTIEKQNWAIAHANKAVNQASINQTELSKQIFSLTSFNEQCRIGEFLTTLDNLITLQQCEPYLILT